MTDGRATSNSAAKPEACPLCGRTDLRLVWDGHAGRICEACAAMEESYREAEDERHDS